MPVLPLGPARPAVPMPVVDVLVAHPEPVGRVVIRSILEEQPLLRVVGVTGDAADTVDTAARLKPAVILVDERLAAAGAIEPLARRSRVILLTGATELQVASLLHQPARGFLVYDNFEPADLVDAVLAVAQGLAWLSPVAASAAVSVMRAGADRTGCPAGCAPMPGRP